VPMHFGTVPPPFATEQNVRSAFRGDQRLRILTPVREGSSDRLVRSGSLTVDHGGDRGVILQLESCGGSGAP
jgi:hypothetical protein